MKLSDNKEELHQEWSCILSVYENMNWQGKYISKKRMDAISRKLKRVRAKENGA